MPEPADCRAVARFPVNGGACCPFLAPVAEALGPVKLKDVSMAGVVDDAKFGVVPEGQIVTPA